MSEIKVNSIKGVAASSAAITINNTDGTCTANITNNLSNRNLVINGAMQVAQRGTSSTSQGYQTIDRWRIDQDSGLTEACTQSQVALSSSDTPYASGFRKAFRITNGNQTSQDVNDYIQLVQKIEARNLAQSGWNYTSSSSNITLSFWVKASVAQTFYVKIEATDASRTFTFPIAVTTSWQKLTKTISGDSNLSFNDDNGVGMRICIIPYYGTSYTTSGHTINTWIASDGANQTPDFANTWFSVNDATFDVTGVQLEVSDHASDFEFRSFGQELALCQRYYFIQMSSKHNSSSDYEIEFITANMRATPTATRLSNVYFGGESSTAFSSIETNTTNQSSEVFTMVYVLRNTSDANCGGKYAFDAEL